MIPIRFIFSRRNESCGCEPVTGDIHMDERHLVESKRTTTTTTTTTTANEIGRTGETTKETPQPPPPHRNFTDAARSFRRTFDRSIVPSDE